MNYRRTFLAAGAVAMLSFTCVQAQQAEAARDTALPAVQQLTMMAASIPCSDVDRSIAFYTKGLGMTVSGKVEMGNVIEVPVMFPGGGAYLLLQHPKTVGAPLPVRSSLNRIALIVPDLEALEARLVAAGYRLKGPIRKLPQYRVAVAHVEDPDGNHIELVQRT